MNRRRRDWLAFALLAACLLAVVGLFALQEHYRQGRDRWSREATLYRDVLAHSQTAIIVVDEHGLVREWSPGASHIFGWSKEEMLGYGLAPLLPDNMRAAHRTAFQRALREGLPRVHEIACHARRKNESGPLAVVIRVWSAEQGGQRVFVALINRQSDIESVRFPSEGDSREKLFGIRVNPRQRFP